MTPAGELRFSQVDAFTDRPYSGNPAAVVVLDAPISERSMQLIAAEMNLSETAFTGHSDDGGRWLRWYTPTVEVPLCGHATLAAAHTLIQEGVQPPIRFSSASGPLAVHRDQERLRLDFPTDAPSPATPPAGLLAALGVEEGSATLRSRNLWVVRVRTGQHLRALTPDHAALLRVDLGRGPLGVSVTCPGGDGIDFQSRFFCPWVGIDEDPVTGVAHTALTPYWVGELGRNPLEARQVSARGGALTVRLEGDRTHLTGAAVTVARGTLVRPPD